MSTSPETRVTAAPADRHTRAATPRRAWGQQLTANAHAWAEQPRPGLMVTPAEAAAIAARMFPPTPAPRLDHGEFDVVRALQEYRYGQLVLPAGLKRPDVPCQAARGAHLCTRALDHRGRHAHIRWGMGRQVRAVWGVRDQADQPTPWFPSSVSVLPETPKQVPALIAAIEGARRARKVAGR